MNVCCKELLYDIKRNNPYLLSVWSSRLDDYKNTGKHWRSRSSPVTFKEIVEASIKNEPFAQQKAYLLKKIINYHVVLETTARLIKQKPEQVKYFLNYYVHDCHTLQQKKDMLRVAAYKYRSVELVEYFLEQGIDPRPEDYHYYCNEIDIASLIFPEYIRPNAMDLNASPYILNAMHDGMSVEILNYLIFVGLNPDLICDDTCNTLLHRYAKYSRWGNSGKIRCLLDNKSDPFQKNINDQLPSDLSNDHNIRKILLEAQFDKMKNHMPLQHDTLNIIFLHYLQFHYIQHNDHHADCPDCVC